jgi:XTP/dITP diphosphohydrolase
VSDRLVLLGTSATVRPGLLSWPAWQVLAGASRVLAGSGEHPLLPALDEAGIGWQLLPGAQPPPAGLAARLAEAAGTVPGTVVWLCDVGPIAGSPDPCDGAPEALAKALRELEASGPAVGEVDVLHGSLDLPGGHLLRLVAVMDTLRTACPWDARQTHESLAPHLLEESYEALEALESGEAGALREELGDVLLQVVFHARMAAERSDGTGYTVDDVADGIVTKLVRRHPHVFAGVTVSGADEVKSNWDAIKAAERESAAGRPTSALDSVPFGQPALALAAQLQRRAERAGAPAELADEPGSHEAGVHEAGAHKAGAHDGGAHDGGAHDGGDIGSELFALVGRARAVGIDPELELRAAARRYRDRVRAWERSRLG